MKYIKIDIGTLPYQLAFRKFKLANGISLVNISFSDEAKIQQEFDKIYSF